MLGFCTFRLNWVISLIQAVDLGRKVSKQIVLTEVILAKSEQQQHSLEHLLHYLSATLYQHLPPSVVFWIISINSRKTLIQE